MVALEGEQKLSSYLQASVHALLYSHRLLVPEHFFTMVLRDSWGESLWPFILPASKAGSGWMWVRWDDPCFKGQEQAGKCLPS